MNAKFEFKNLFDHYGLEETLNALSDILIEQHKPSTLVRNFLLDICGEFDIYLEE